MQNVKNHQQVQQPTVNTTDAAQQPSKEATEQAVSDFTNAMRKTSKEKDDTYKHSAGTQDTKTTLAAQSNAQPFTAQDNKTALAAQSNAQPFIAQDNKTALTAQSNAQPFTAQDNKTAFTAQNSAQNTAQDSKTAFAAQNSAQALTAQGDKTTRIGQNSTQAFTAHDSKTLLAQQGQNANTVATSNAPTSLFDSKLFSMSGKKDINNTESEKKPNPSSESHAVPNGDTLLNAMTGITSQSNPVTVNTSNIVGSNPINTDMTTKLVERILVSAPDAKGNAEVRILLQDNVLPGTEVRIQRSPDGALNVQFVTNDVRAEQMLGTRQLTDLQTSLTQNLQVDVRVTTTRTDGSMTADAGTGQQDQGSQQNQGNQDQNRRSSQHDLFDNLQEEQA